MIFAQVDFTVKQEQISLKMEQKKSAELQFDKILEFYLALTKRKAGLQIKAFIPRGKRTFRNGFSCVDFVAVQT